MVLSLSACCDFADTCSAAKIQASVLFLDLVTSCRPLQPAQAGLTSVYHSFVYLIIDESSTSSCMH